MTDNLVVYWSQELARRDAQESHRQIEKARQAIQQKRTAAGKKGYRRYMATQGKWEVVGIDEARIEQDARWDDYLAIQSSVEDMDSLQLLEAYHQLWRIENAFRVLKSTMRTRPIYHWTPRRIKGHIVVCFMAFVLERALEVKLKRHLIHASPEQIRQALNSLQLSEVQLGDQVFYLKGKHNLLAGKIFKALRLKHLKNVLEKEQLHTLFT